MRLKLGAQLTSIDPKPPAGTTVRDAHGTVWERSFERHYWLQEEHPDWDPESWTKVAGNYGPVTVIEVGEGDD